MIRIGSVPYLNARALVFGLQPGPSERYTLEFNLPSVLVRKLRAGGLDVALVSAVEYFRSPGYRIIPDIAIAAHREMWSIQLFHRKPLREIRRVALDPASETSNALLYIVLREKLRLDAELVPLRLGDDPLANGDLDGFLKIGDPCLTFQPPPGYAKLDLISQWHEFTNLPFVFAVWLVRKEVDLAGINQDLLRAKTEGVRHAEQIALADAPRLGLDFQLALTYVSKIVKYDLGDAELKGLDMFRRCLARRELVPAGDGFEFYTR